MSMHPFGDGVPTVLVRHLGPPALAHLLSESLIGQKPLGRVGQGGHIAERHQQPVNPFVYHAGNSTRAGGDDRATGQRR